MKLTGSLDFIIDQLVDVWSSHQLVIKNIIVRCGNIDLTIFEEVQTKELVCILELLLKNNTETVYLEYTALV